MEKCYLAIDAGTTSVKILLSDGAGRPLFMADAPASAAVRSGGGTEVDMERYWDVVCGLTRRASEAHPVRWRGLSGVCAAGQGDGLWPLDREGRSFMPAITWQDTRAGRYCTGEALERLQQEQRCNRMLAGSRGAILAWLKEEAPAAYRRTAHPLSCVSFINYRLTESLATDETNCGDSFDIVSGAYIPELYDCLGIGEMVPRLPVVLPAGACIGRVTAGASVQTCIPEGVPVYNGCLDATAAVLGENRLEEGHALICAGTTLLVMEARAKPPVFPLEEGCYADRLPYDPPLFRRCFAPSCGAAAIAYEKDRYAPQTGYAELYRRIEGVPAGSGGMTYLPFLHGERSPFLCPEAQAGFYYERAEHTVWHRMRAVIEGVLFAARHCLDVAGGTFSSIELTGGAARSPVFCQMAADILGCPVCMREALYSGANGCIALMLRAQGRSVSAPVEPAVWFTPDRGKHREETRAYERYRETVKEMLPVWRNEENERR